MWPTFDDYCKHRDAQLGEMAQSLGDPKGTRIHLDDQDRDFIAQAVAKGITPVSALRTRYTLLLRDKPGERGPVRFFGSGRRPFVTVNVERTHLRHLQDKLRALGAANVAEHGFRPLKAIDPADAAAFYNAAFGRQNASDILRRGKPIDVNYGVGGVESAVMIRSNDGTEKDHQHPPAGRQQPNARQGEVQARSAILKPVPNDWSTSYLAALFSDPSRTGEVNRLHKRMEDFTPVWDAVHSLVGDTGEPGKHILPEVWEMFEKSLPGIGRSIYEGVLRQLKQFDPSALEDVLELKQALMQSTAMILSNPLRGVRARTGDFQRGVQHLFSDRDQLFKLAMSYTSQGHLRHASGIRTTNTRRREVSGVMTGKPFDLENIGREAKGGGSDVEMEAALRQLEPAMVPIWAKLKRNYWDTSKLTDRERAVFVQYEELTNALQQFQRSYRGSGQRPVGAAAFVRQPTLQPERAKMEQIEAELRHLQPLVQPIINKLDADGWDMSRVSEDDWEKYRRYQQLSKELNRLRGIALLDVDDMNVATGAQHQFQPQPIRMRRECARAAHGPLLNFAAWCQKR